MSTSPFRIAILTKDAPYHNKVIDGFYERMENFPARCECRTYTVPSGLSWHDATNSMREVLNLRPHLIVSIGALCSQVARMVLEQNKSTIPLLFGGVTVPAQLNLVPSPKNPHPTSGVSLGFLSSITNAQVLAFIKPYAKKVLLPYSPSADSGILTSAAQLVKEYLEKKNIHVTLLPISQFDPRAALAQITQHIEYVDTLMTLEGCVLNEIDTALIALCNEQEVTFFSSEIGSIEAGAAAGFVADPTTVGAHLAHYVHKLLIEQQSVSNLPILFLGNKGRRIAINKEACKRQQLTIDPITTYLLEHGTVVGRPDMSEGDRV